MDVIHVNHTEPSPGRSLAIAAHINQAIEPTRIGCTWDPNGDICGRKLEMLTWENGTTPGFWLAFLAGAQGVTHGYQNHNVTQVAPLPPTGIHIAPAFISTRLGNSAASLEPLSSESPTGAADGSLAPTCPGSSLVINPNLLTLRRVGLARAIFLCHWAISYTDY